MPSLLRKVLSALFVAFVAVTLGAAGNAVYADHSSSCNGMGEIGPCPSLGSPAANEAACSCACEILMMTPGACDSGCCQCAV